MTNLNEIWLTIPSYPNYSVSNQGHIKSLRSGKILKPFSRWVTKGGRKVKKACTVRVSNHQGQKTFTVHYLILNTFKPCSDLKLSIDHIDRNPFNNTLTNLRWATSKQQIDNRVGVRKKTVLKISMDDIEAAFKRTRSEVLSEIAKDYQMSSYDLHKLLIYMHPLY